MEHVRPRFTHAMRRGLVPRVVRGHERAPPRARLGVVVGGSGESVPAVDTGRPCYSWLVLSLCVMGNDVGEMRIIMVHGMFLTLLGVALGVTGLSHDGRTAIMRRADGLRLSSQRRRARARREAQPAVHRPIGAASF